MEVIELFSPGHLLPRLPRICWIGIVPALLRKPLINSRVTATVAILNPLGIHPQINGTGCLTIGSMQSARVIKEIDQQCREKSLRLTPTRKRVLELVLEADGPVKAYDLLDQLKAEQPSAAPPTVYRALDFLLRHHFIHRLETLNAFVSCFHPDHRHHGQFLICDRCESVTEILDERVSQELAGVARREGFEPSRQVLEVYGTCRACRKQDRP